MTWEQVQSLVLRPAQMDAVLHVMLRVEPTRGGEALRELADALEQLPLTLGEGSPATGTAHCTLGFSYRGLEALGLPPAYLHIFSRLAPAFAQGAPLRAARLGDSGASAPPRWKRSFDLDNAHLVVTLHGAKAEVDTLQDLVRIWRENREGSAVTCVDVLRGDRLGAPPGHTGQWVHFRYRDGLVDHHIDGLPRRTPNGSPRPGDPAAVAHAAGEFLLGHPNDNGFNPFALPLAPADVRRFFHGSSFGVLRPMEQDVHRFESAVGAWQAQAQAQFGNVHADWVRAKLCGRWPSGYAIQPGQLKPDVEDIQLKFDADAQALGCPWFSHVRRMNALGHAGGTQRERTLLRRGMPFGPANWQGTADTVQRGLLGLFFCASLEDQFEELVGQWGSGPPPGAPAGEFAADPFTARNGDEAVAIVRVDGKPELKLKGFQAWTQTLGTVFAWYPGGQAVARILNEDYVPPDEGGPWL